MESRWKIVSENDNGRAERRRKLKETEAKRSVDKNNFRRRWRWGERRGKVMIKETKKRGLINLALWKWRTWFISLKRGESKSQRETCSDSKAIKNMNLDSRSLDLTQNDSDRRWKSYWWMNSLTADVVQDTLQLQPLICINHIKYHPECVLFSLLGW